jgi:hypothetical protein
MSKTGEQGKVPPPALNEDDNLIVVEDGSNTETSTAPIVEELLKQLEKLNAEVKRLKAKGKKGKRHSHQSEDDDSSFEVLGMQAKGHEDSKTKAHPRMRILMNLRSETKDHTHLHSFLQDQVTATELWYVSEAGSEVTPDLEVSRQRWRLSQRSPACLRSPQPVTQEGGHMSCSYSRGTKTYVNLKGL